MNHLESVSVLAWCGSLRKGSYNRQLLSVARQYVQAHGATAVETDFSALALPAYNQDIDDAAFPPAVSQLQDAIAAADILLIASPEYNHSIPGWLKNVIDWTSRQRNPYKGKVAVIMGASTGPFGTVRMQPHLRQVLASLDALVVPFPQVMVRGGGAAFTPSGDLVDEKTAATLEQALDHGLDLARRLKIGV